MKYIDLTRTISEKTVVYPGDPCFAREHVSRAEVGKIGSFNLYHLHMSNHLGTHVDYPAHLIPRGKTSSDYTIDDLTGDGCIIAVPAGLRCVTAEFLKSQDIQAVDIVFFKTMNSELSEDDPLAANYVCLGTDAAEELVKKGVRVVGIDYLSVDAHDSEDLPVHNILLGSGVLIVEGLDLKDAEPGRGEMIIAPLKISSIDGSPARVLMKRK